MIQNQKVPNAKFFETRITRWFDEVLRARYGARDAKVAFDTSGTGSYDNEVIFDVVLKQPEAKEIKRLCADANFHKNNAAAICKK